MSDSKTPQDGLHLKKHLGLTGAISYIAGGIIGVGIFISPSSVLEGAGSSMGVSLLIWLLCGILSFCGAMCYAEFGTRVKKSGGSYTYIKIAFGDFAAFLTLWTQLILVRPLAISVCCLAAATYIVRPVFLYCPQLAPDTAKTLLAVVLLVMFIAANAYSVRLGVYLQTFVTVCKVSALLMIIVGGVVHLAEGHTENFKNPFHTTNLQPGGVAFAFYAGIFAYSGWDIVNMAVEEIINPQRTIPIAIFVGLMIPTATYMLANIAYHAVLTNQEILSGMAVAVMFGEERLGVLKWAVTPCVAISAAGLVNAIIFMASRYSFVGSRDGLLPRFLSMVTVHKQTPLPSTLLQLVISLVYMCLGDIKSVLGAYAFFRCLCEVLAVSGLRRIRKKVKASPDTYIVNPVFPVMYLLSSSTMMVMAVVFNAETFIYPLAICVLGVPVYIVSKTKWWSGGAIQKINNFIIVLCQRLFMCDFASEEVAE